MEPRELSTGVRAGEESHDVPADCHKMLDMGIGSNRGYAAFETVKRSKSETTVKRRGLPHFLLILVGKCGVLRSHCFSFRSSPPAQHLSVKKRHDKELCLTRPDDLRSPQIEGRDPRLVVVRLPCLLHDQFSRIVGHEV
jgi:hypothetical protein